jgi:TM2 domain-containing membrane protein YozV
MLNNMQINRSIFCFFLTIALCISSSVRAIELKNEERIPEGRIRQVSDTVYLVSNGFPVDSLINKNSSVKETRKKKFVSAIFAFPFPFGFMGAHRIMLGTKPWIPVIYAVTFGGCFGLLPLIDFFVITFSKDIEQYENNPHVFMWVK